VCSSDLPKTPKPHSLKDKRTKLSFRFSFTYSDNMIEYFCDYLVAQLMYFNDLSL